MRIVHLALAVCVVVAVSGASSPAVMKDPTTSASKVAPLILEKDEGEKRVWRPVEGLEGGPGKMAARHIWSSEPRTYHPEER
jgi:hypothetical protein